MSRLPRKAWRWLVGTWAAVTAVAVGAVVAPTTTVDHTGPLPVVQAQVTAPAPTPGSAASGSGVGEQGGPVLDPAPTTTTARVPPTTSVKATVKPKAPATSRPAAPPPAPAAVPAVGPLGGRIVAAARTFYGVPYLWGGTSLLGLDCSGLVVLVMHLVGLNPPRTAAQQAAWTIRIPASAAQPGDLVFEGSPAHHVGIYIGSSQMIDAQDVGTVVGVHTIPSGSYYGRVPS